jgi:hypothetical protein
MSLRHLLPVLLALLSASRDASAAVTLWTTVHVRVYDAALLPPAERDAALAVTASLVATAAVDLVWTICEPAPSRSARRVKSGSPRCDVPLRPGDLAIRIVRSPVPLAETGVLPLGEALIDGARGAGVLATIYADRVWWTAHRTGVKRDVLLGRTIAHELGHLLLATSTHGTTGLMRPIWSRFELRRSRASDWSFAAGESAAISARVRALIAQAE